MGKLVVAGLSSRLMAEAAARDGYGPIALDAFGDADTRRASTHWQPIGAPSELKLDAQRTLAALAQLSQRGDVLGWVAGSGFEAQADLLEAGAQTLPLLGTPPGAVRRLRDPRVFFSFLAVHGLAHPEVRYSPPPPAAGWLYKRADGTGGTHIREADAMRNPTPGGYYQRRLEGTPMSALFIGNGHEARVLGFHELIVRPMWSRPFVYCGAIGPMRLPPALDATLREAASRLTAEFGLLGLCSLDFLRTGPQGYALLEVNPRPSASMALHAHLPLMRWHVQACRQRTLPSEPLPAPQLRGHEIVFTQRDVQLASEQAAALASHPDTHDVPHGAASFAAGEPLCSVSATGAAGAGTASVRAGLTRQHQAVLRLVSRPVSGPVSDQQERERA